MKLTCDNTFNINVAFYMKLHQILSKTKNGVSGRTHKAFFHIVRTFSCVVNVMVSYFVIQQ
jgi:uncharacterized membrane protein required for colicin V production